MTEVSQWGGPANKHAKSSIGRPEFLQKSRNGEPGPSLLHFLLSIRPFYSLMLAVHRIGFLGNVWFSIEVFLFTLTRQAQHQDLD